MEWSNVKGEPQASSNSKLQFQFSNYGTIYTVPPCCRWNFHRARERCTKCRATTLDGAKTLHRAIVHRACSVHFSNVAPYTHRAGNSCTTLQCSTERCMHDASRKNTAHQSWNPSLTNNCQMLEIVMCMMCMMTVTLFWKKSPCICVRESQAISTHSLCARRGGDLPLVH